MSDIQLDSNHDLDISGDDLVLTSGVDAIKQHLSQRLKTFYGEYFLNTTVGVPYFQQILIKNPNPVILDSLFKKEIINTEGVLQLLEFTLDYDNSTRQLSISFRAQCTDGVLDFSEAIP